VDELILPAGIGPGHGCHLYVVRLDTDKVEFTRDAFRVKLKEPFGVTTGLHYPAVWTGEAFEGIDHDRTDCPGGDEACSQVLSLPIFPKTSFEDLEYIREAITGVIVHLKREGACNVR